MEQVKIKVFDNLDNEEVQKSTKSMIKPMNSNWSFQTVIINVPAVSKYFVNVTTQPETLRKK